MGQETLYVQFVSLVIVGCVFVIGMLCDVVLIREERSDTAKLQDALTAIHDCQFILTHKIFTQLLIIQAVGNFPAPAFTGVVGVDGFLAQRRGQFLQGCWLLAAQEDGSVHVADDGIGIILVDGFQLGLGLQNQTGRDFSGADRSDQLLQTGNLTDVSSLVNEAANMNRKPATVNIVSLFTQQIEQLGRVEPPNDAADLYLSRRPCPFTVRIPSRVVAVIRSRSAIAMSFFTASSTELPQTTSTLDRRR